MTWTYSDEDYKKYTRDTWNESADRYDAIRERLDLWNADLLRVAAPARGERVLDIATGPGEPALSLAPMVGPTGRVLGIDLSERMVDRARENAKRRGLTNAEFAVMDAESLDVPHGTYDLVTSRFGIQIVTNPDKAVAQARDALRPGGRLVATVWSPGHRNAFLHAIIGPMLDHAEPDETGYIPTPYELGDDGELADMLRAVGYSNVSEQRVRHETVWASETDYMQAMLQGTPIGHSLGEEDEDVQRQVLDACRANLRAAATPRGIVLSAEALVVRAER